MEVFNAVGIHVFAGLFTRGVVDAGANVVCMLEDGEFGTKTHALNFPRVPIHTDKKTWPVQALKGRKIDLIYSNSACAGFSLANATKGLDNDSNMGLRESCESALDLEPGAYVVESVTNLFKMGDPMVREWEDMWMEKGYYTCRLVENAAHVGVPQKRGRALFIAAKYPLDFSYTGNHEVHRTVRDAIYDLKDLPMDIGYQTHKAEVASVYQAWMRRGAEGQVNWHVASKMTRAVESLLPYLKPGQRFDALSDEIYAKTYWPNRVHVINPRGKPSLLYRRLDWDQPSVVLTGSAMLFHPDHNRLITVREKARLMGVPDNFTFHSPPRKTGINDAYNEIGKAVSPIVGQWVVKQLMALSQRTDTVHHSYVDLVKRTKVESPYRPSAICDMNKFAAALDGEPVAREPVALVQ